MIDVLISFVERLVSLVKTRQQARGGAFDLRREAMEALIAVRGDRDEFDDSEAYVRRSRRGTRLEHIGHR